MKPSLRILEKRQTIMLRQARVMKRDREAISMTETIDWNPAVKGSVVR